MWFWAQSTGRQSSCEGAMAFSSSFVESKCANACSISIKRDFSSSREVRGSRCIGHERSESATCDDVLRSLPLGQAPSLLYDTRGANL